MAVPRLACAIAANKKLLPHKRATLENCFATATELDPWKSSKEGVAVYPKKKISGGFRIIHKF